MDKNFISVDDLVRQRLGGGEEQERAGSWLRMRELLDKEIPQPPVGFNWRRMFSAVAVLLLISAGGIGTYELTANKNNSNEPVIATATNTASTTPAAKNTNETVSNTQLSTTENKEARNNEVNNIPNNTPNTPSSATTANHIKTAGTHKRTHTSNIAVNKKADNGALLAANTAAPVSKKALSKEVVVNTDNNVNATLPGKADSKAQNNEPPSTTPAATAIAANNVKADKKETASASNTIRKKTNRHQSNTPAKTMTALALNTNAPAANNNTTAPAVKPVATATHKSTSPHKHAVTSNLSAANKTATVNTSNPVSVASMQATPAATASKAARKTAGYMQKKAAALPLAASAANNVAPNPVAHTARKGSRQVQQLMITQRFIKTSPTQGYFHLDTISQETITQEYDLAETNAPDLSVFGPPPYDKPAEVSNHTVITMNSRDNVKNKKTGSSTMENLSAAFNDAKNKVSGVHFATGLTAGINGTFFGPNSFKGFQFGVTENFTFSENLSIMSELKYVHRINNDYTLSDNYYNYTPNPTGGYTRELVNDPYSFSTLHSFELPISVRYCIEKFNFFVGGNFVYTFAINTGAYPLADPATATQVSAPGNDNAPKLKADDFGATFGFGYLFGASYQVAPNVMIDIRNVQTIWNNANSSGAKIISNQLYKSPSLQLSIGYRLGNNKNKDK